MAIQNMFGGGTALLRRRAMLRHDKAIKWDYEWDYTMGSPDTSFWDYPIGGGKASFGEDGLYLKSVGNSYAGLRALDAGKWLARKATYEIDVKVWETSSNGFRIICASGNAGVPDGKGLQVTINGNYLNVITGNQVLTTISRSEAVTYGEWHKVRLELDVEADDNRIYLDDKLISAIPTSELSTVYAENVWCLAQVAEAYIRSVRYKKYE